jgi:hypothetical protein
MHGNAENTDKPVAHIHTGVVRRWQCRVSSTGLGLAVDAAVVVVVSTGHLSTDSSLASAQSGTPSQASTIGTQGGPAVSDDAGAAPHMTTSSPRALQMETNNATVGSMPAVETTMA